MEATFLRLHRTWEKFEVKVRRLILANIRADLNSRIVGARKINPDEESSQALDLDIESSAVYAAELKEELDAKVAEQQLVWDLDTVDLGDRRELQSPSDPNMIGESQTAQMFSQHREIDEPPEAELTELDHLIQAEG